MISAQNRFCLLIGAMKCGTTSVFRYLAQHPQIAPCSQKEPDFFNDDALWDKGLSWYRTLWDWDPGLHAWALEGSTEYTNPGYSAKVIDRIATVDAEFRFLYVVRDPVARMESHYNHGYSAGWLSRDVPIDDAIDRLPHVVRRTLYASHLDRYRERFGAGSLLVINFSDLIEDPGRQMDRVLEFLNLEPYTFADLKAVHNPGRGRLLEHPLIIAIRLRFPALFQTLRNVLPEKIQKLGRQALGSRGAEQFRFSPETRARIIELLRDDLERLRNVYGVDTSNWDLGD